MIRTFRSGLCLTNSAIHLAAINPAGPAPCGGRTQSPIVSIRDTDANLTMINTSHSLSDAFVILAVAVWYPKSVGLSLMDDRSTRVQVVAMMYLQECD